jgi:hypothetical protein
MNAKEFVWLFFSFFFFWLKELESIKRGNKYVECNFIFFGFLVKRTRNY